MEVWKDISGYEGFYKVSNLGRVMSLKNARVLIEQNNGTGYMRVALSKNGVTKAIYIHRLVAMAFCENPQNKPCVNHIDYDRRNNAASNLEWCTPKENTSHSIEHFYGQKNSSKTSNTGEKYIYFRNNKYYVKLSCESRYAVFKDFGSAIEHRNRRVMEAYG